MVTSQSQTKLGMLLVRIRPRKVSELCSESVVVAIVHLAVGDVALEVSHCTRSHCLSSMS